MIKTTNETDKAKLIASVFRQKPEKIYIGEVKISGKCAAFSDWRMRLKAGEKLPRGRYFRFCTLTGMG